MGNQKEKFIIDLSDLYTTKNLWEEEFCFVYQMLVRLNFYRANEMKKKTKKLEEILDSMPKRKAFVKKTFSKAAPAHSRKAPTQNCLKVAQDRLHGFKNISGTA